MQLWGGTALPVGHCKALGVWGPGPLLCSPAFKSLVQRALRSQTIWSFCLFGGTMQTEPNHHNPTVRCCCYVASNLLTDTNDAPLSLLHCSFSWHTAHCLHDGLMLIVALFCFTFLPVIFLLPLLPLTMLSTPCCPVANCNGSLLPAGRKTRRRSWRCLVLQGPDALMRKLWGLQSMWSLSGHI